MAMTSLGSAARAWPAAGERGSVGEPHPRPAAAGRGTCAPGPWRGHRRCPWPRRHAPRSASAEAEARLGAAGSGGAGARPSAADRPHAAARRGIPAQEQAERRIARACRRRTRHRQAAPYRAAPCGPAGTDPTAVMRDGDRPGPTIRVAADQMAAELLLGLPPARAAKAASHSAAAGAAETTAPSDSRSGWRPWRPGRTR